MKKIPKHHKFTFRRLESSLSAESNGSRHSNSASTWLYESGTTGLEAIAAQDRRCLLTNALRLLLVAGPAKNKARS